MAATLVENQSTLHTFELPQDWTIRQVAHQLAREWLAHLRPEVVAKAVRWNDRWAIQPIVEPPANSEPLWEAGISTEEYEHRLDHPDVAWTIQARAGRPKFTANCMVLAHLSMSSKQPMAFDLVSFQVALPEPLIDPDKLAAYLAAHGDAQADELIPSLLIDRGFRVTPALTTA